MDIVDSCKAIIEERLQKLEAFGEEDLEAELDTQTQSEVHNESQTFSEGYFSDPDKNLNKILNQQAHLKRIIDQDNQIQLAKSQIVRVSLEIEGIRRSCTKQNEDALKNQHELAEAQAKEVSSYRIRNEYWLRFWCITSTNSVYM